MHAYSQDLRDRILGALDRGEGPTAIARRFAQIRQWIEATPDLTLVELSERLAVEGIQIKVPALWLN